MRALQSYIGKQWQIPCDGVTTFDCWELALQVRRYLGKVTPLYMPKAQRSEDHNEMEGHAGDWVQLDTPNEGCLVTFGEPARHCGVMVSATDMIHSTKGRGVQVNNLTVSQRAFGPTRYWELKI